MKQEFSLENSLAEIRSIVEQMQSGVSDFDKQIELFKKGNKLIKACQNYLNEAELEVKQLIGNELQDF